MVSTNGLTKVATNANVNVGLPLKLNAPIKGKLNTFREVKSGQSQGQVLPDLSVFKEVKTVPVLSSFPSPEGNGILPKSTLPKFVEKPLSAAKAVWNVSDRVNPVSYVKQGISKLEEACYVVGFSLSGSTTLTSIICFTMTFLHYLIWVISGLITIFISTLVTIFLILIALVIFILPFLPILLVLFVISLVCQTVWDDVIVYIIIGFIDVYNGVVNAWNGLTGIFNNLGINFRILGNNIHIPLLNLNLPQGDTISANVPGFRQFIMDIIDISIILPLKAMTDGIIFR